MSPASVEHAEGLNSLLTMMRPQVTLLLGMMAAIADCTSLGVLTLICTREELPIPLSKYLDFFGLPLGFSDFRLGFSGFTLEFSGLFGFGDPHVNRKIDGVRGRY